MGDLTCTECHNDGTELVGRATAWADSMHGMGEAYVRGTSASCAGCHSGGGFSAKVAAGLNPDEVEAGDPNPTRQDCRACHQIHVTYTGEDWALETEDPVDFYAFEGVTYDWGPHHGGQGSMLMGVAGSPDVEGSPSSHATMVEDTCVACHMGEEYNHSFEPQVERCQECHSGMESFDDTGLQTEVQEKLDQLEAELVARGWLDEEGHPAVTFVPAPEAYALWNWIYIAHEDGSLGVHNPAYTRDLLDASLETLGLGGQ
jgi:hypothetical protein